MANIKAQASGVWNATGTWSGGVIPGPGDNVYANGFSVTINVDITVALISTQADATSGAAAGGGFVCSTARNINANIQAGNATSTTALGTSGANTINITGNITGGGGNGAYGLVHSGNGIVNVVGNISSGTFGGLGTVNCMGVYNSSTTAGVINIVGNVTAGTSEACYCESNGSINVTGTVTGSTGHGLYVRTSGTITVNGNCIGAAGAASGAGLFVNAVQTGTVTVNGIAIGGASSSTNTTQAGVLSTRFGGSITVRQTEFATTGMPGVVGFVKFDNTFSPTVKVYRLNGASITLSDPADVANQVPAATDVRNGVNYLNGTRTGSLKVPAPSDVRRSVQTDNTVGAADLTVTDFLDAIQAAVHPMAVRLRNVSTVDSTGEQIETAING